MKTKQIFGSLIVVILLTIYSISIQAQNMYIKLNDQGPQAQPGEYYYVLIMYVENTQNQDQYTINSGGSQFTNQAYSLYPNNTWMVSFTAGIPTDVESKIFRVRFRLVRDDSYPPAIPYIAEGDDYSVMLNSSDFYSAGGFIGNGDLQ